MLLNNRTLEPVPLKIFNNPSDQDVACDIYKNFANCTRSLGCRFEFTAATQETLLRVCTVRYEDYKANAICLNKAANSPKGVECTAPLFALNLTIPQTDGGKGACQAINTMIACISPTLNDQCTAKATDVVYDIHSAFAKQFKPDCVVKPPVLLVPGTDCTRPEIDAFEACTRKPNNYSINPISIIADTDRWSDFCKTVTSDFQSCLKNLTCTPKPFSMAFNDSLVYACTSDAYGKHKACLGAVLNTPTGQQCVQDYKDVQWYAGDDPSGNPGRACKTVSSALSCAAPEISQRCEQDAVKFVYDLNQRMMTNIQSDCKLVIPANLPVKLNLTTTTEAPTPSKTTPSKVKEATTPSKASFERFNGRILLGSTLLCVVLNRFVF